ncbi:MAG: hypothetical protein NTV23_12880 [Propionibacteriales bacterium]|nr:hypothetical protein [Propionibacteriales bacterium]
MRTFRLLLVTALAATGLSIAAQAPASAAGATVGGFSQCENGAGTALGCVGGWVNGSLQSSNSHYTEDDVVPQRALINLPADSLEHSLTFTYQDRKGSIHAYDSLATWNRTSVAALPCQGLAAALCAGVPDTLQMTEDPTLSVPPAGPGISTAPRDHDLPDAARQWTMYGADLTSDTAPSHDSAAAGDDLVTVTVRFRNTTPGTAKTAVLLFGGHLAVGAPATLPRSWGAGFGASSVSGGPYAFKLDKVDGASTGATANSIQGGSAVAPVPPAAYTITKTASATTASAGGQITYTVTVTNTGGQPGTTTFTDDYNNNLTNVSTPSGCTQGSGAMTCTTNPIAGNGGTQVFTYTANMPASFSGGVNTGGCTGGTYPVSNTATLAANPNNTTNTSATALVCVSAAAQFAISKTASTTTATTGQVVSYAITVTNNGNAAGSTSFTDTYAVTPGSVTISGTGGSCSAPALGSMACTTGSIPAGASQTFTYDATMPASFDGGTACTGGYQVANKVTITGGPSATVNVCVQAAPAFTVVKSANVSVANPGDVVTYTLKVTNTGTASGTTSVTDTPAAGITLGTLPPGCASGPNGSFTCTTGPILAGASTNIVYTATMPSTFDGTPATNGCADDTYAITNTATIGLSTSTKTVCVGAVATYEITKAATPATAVPGQVVTYTVAVKNTGMASGSTSFVDVYDSRITPTLPTSPNAGSSCTPGAGKFTCATGKLVVGATATFTYTAAMPATFGATSGGSGCATGTYPVRNTATLANSNLSGLGVVCVAAAPKYEISKTVSPKDALPSDLVTYTVTVKNTGAASGSTSFVDDHDNRLTLGGVTILPSGGTCSPGAGVLNCTTDLIPAGAQQTFTYSARVPATYSGVTGGGTCTSSQYRIANSAVLGTLPPATADVCVTAAPRFVLDKSVSDESAAPGDTVTYTITVSNTGSAAGGTTFVDDFDNRLDSSITAPTGCTKADGKLSCTTGTILANGSETFSYSAVLPATFTGPGGGDCAPGQYAVKNTAGIPSGSSDSVLVCVAAAPTFTITKTATPQTVGVGSTVTYTVTVTNTGPASGSTGFVDDYDNRLNPTVPNGCTKADGKLSCTTGDIASGDNQVFTYTAVMPATFLSTAPTGTCAPGAYGIANDVTLDGGASTGAQVCVSAAPAFSVAKSVDDANVLPGESVTYTIKVTNTGTAGGSTTFSDTPDSRLSPSSAVSTPSGNTCAPSGAVGARVFSNCPTGVIEPGASQSFTYTAQMPATFTGESGGGDCDPGEYQVANTVTAGGSTASQDVCVAAAATFTVKKTADRYQVNPGSTVSYTVVVTNTGTAAGSTSFTDDYDATATVTAPAGCTVDAANTAFSCTTGTINAGESQSFTYSGVVPMTFVGSPDSAACTPPAFAIINKATLANDLVDKVTVCVAAGPEYTITKAADSKLVEVGAPVRYTVTVKNIGSATGATTFTDTPDSQYDLTGVTVAGCLLANGTFTCSTGDLDPGVSKVFTFDLTAPANFTGTPGLGTCDDDRYLLANSAMLRNGPTVSDDVCVAAAPAYTVTKTADETLVDAGDTVTYTVTVTNTGTAAGTTDFVDDYDDRLTLSAVDISGSGGSCSVADGNLSCSTGTINAGGTQTFTYAADMPETFTGTSGGRLCDPGRYAVINSVNGYPDAAVIVCVAAAPRFTVTKTADTTSTTPGQDVTYTVVVTNEGNATGRIMAVDDYDPRLGVVGAPCPQGPSTSLRCETGPLNAGQSATFTYTGRLPSSFDGPTGGVGCPADQYRVPNTVTLANGASATVVVCVDADAAFSITKSVDDESGEPGQTVEYTVTVTNLGNAAGGTSFDDDYNDRLSPTLPDGCTDNTGSFTCTTDVLAAGASQDFVYTAKLPATYPAVSGTNGCADGSYGFENTATLESDGPSATARVCVAAAPDLSIDKTAQPTSVKTGDTVSYTVVVTNSGPAAAPATTFVDDYTDTLTDVTLPAGCVQGNGQFTCTTEVIESGKDQTFTYSAKIPASFTGDSGGADCPDGTFPVANAVNVTGGPSDDVTLCVPAAPKFTVAKTVDTAVVDPGATVTYTVTVKNTGDASGSTTFTDDYDDSLDATISVPAGCAKVDKTLQCSTEVLNAGTSQPFTYSAQVPTTFDGTPGGGDCTPVQYRIANSVTSTSGASAAQDVCVTAAPKFVVDKTVDKPQAEPGDTVHYTVTVTNTGAAAGSTTIVDDYDNRLDPTVPAGCTKAAGTLSCDTGKILAGGSTKFEYDAVLPLTYSGDSGVDPCAPGQYSVANEVTIGDEVKASQTVCVAAAAKFTATKVADDTTADPGQQVTYTVTVTNTGSVAGTSTFVDDYDNRLDATITVPTECTKAGGKLTCTTGVIEPGASQKITYAATMPATFTGPSGQGGCLVGAYPVSNSVVLGGGANAAATVCVAAAAKLGLVKSDTIDTTGFGDQTITYTLTYTNSGTAESLGTVVTDQLPAGTGFVSCAPACTTPGNLVTWNVGAVAPAGGTGTVQLVVRVTSNQTCVITNVAQIRANEVTTTSSNTVTTNVVPQPDTANAKSNGSAVGLSIRTSGLLDLVGPIVGGLFTNNNTLALSRASSSQSGPGGPSTGSDSLLSVKLPSNGSLARAGVLTATSASVVTPAPAEARTTTTSEVAGVCLIPVGGLCTVETGTVRAVATTMANGTYAAVSTAGSTIQSLRVAGVAVPVDLNQTTTIPLNKAVFGPNSYVAINERTGSSGLSGQKYTADQSVAMIHVKITGLLLGVQAAEIYVAQATSHSEFPKTFLCAGAKNQSVSGHAYTARLYTGPILADLIQGYAQVSPLGGVETEHVAQAVIPSTGVVVNAKVADSSSAGAFTASGSTARSWAEVTGDGTKPACVLSYVRDCVATATLIRSEVNSAASASGSTSKDTGTSLVGLSVLGIPIAGTPAPNTTIALPGIGFIVLNEQFCDNGAAVSHTCTASGHTGLTVRAVRVVVTVANNLLGLTPGVELIVAEAHADTTFG